MSYLGGLGVQKAKVQAISQVPQPTDVKSIMNFLRLVLLLLEVCGRVQ